MHLEYFGHTRARNGSWCCIARKLSSCYDRATARDRSDAQIGCSRCIYKGRQLLLRPKKCCSRPDNAARRHHPDYPPAFLQIAALANLPGFNSINAFLLFIGFVEECKIRVSTEKNILTSVGYQDIETSSTHIAEMECDIVLGSL